MWIHHRYLLKCCALMWWLQPRDQIMVFFLKTDWFSRKEGIEKYRLCYSCCCCCFWTCTKFRFFSFSKSLLHFLSLKLWLCNITHTWQTVLGVGDSTAGKVTAREELCMGCVLVFFALCVNPQVPHYCIKKLSRFRVMFFHGGYVTFPIICGKLLLLGPHFVWKFRASFLLKCYHYWSEQTHYA